MYVKHTRGLSVVAKSHFQDGFPNALKCFYGFLRRKPPTARQL